MKKLFFALLLFAATGAVAQVKILTNTEQLGWWKFSGIKFTAATQDSIAPFGLGTRLITDRAAKAFARLSAKKAIDDSSKRYYFKSAAGAGRMAYKLNDSTYYTLGLVAGSNITFLRTVDGNGDSVVVISSAGGGVGGGMTIGGTVTGANEYNVFYAGASGVLAQSADFRWNNGTKRLLLSSGPDELHIDGARSITPYNNGSVANLDIGANKVMVNGLQINSPASGTVASAAAFDASGNIITAPYNQVASGTYTPAVTQVENVGPYLAYTATYIRVGNVVTVYGSVNIGATIGGSTSIIYLSTPVNSAFTTVGQAYGSFTGALNTFYGPITSTNVVNVVRLDVTMPDTSVRNYYYQYQYQVL
jgi:hypothetical protein